MNSTAPTRAGAVGQGTFVPSQFFGMHVEQQFDVGWPSASFTTQRIWDVYPSVSWAALNPAKGRYDWVPLDRLVEDSRRHGVDLVYVFGAVPRWASSEPDGPCGTAPAGSCRPPDPAAWRDFIARITVRYGSRIQYWELWNEPDARNFWAGTPGQLVALAREAYPIIKASGGTVLSPAPQGRNGPRWMEGYLRAGGTPYADVNAFHAYLYDAPEALNELVRAYRTLFERFGIAGRPLWDTEHSWGEVSAPFGSDPGSQAAWLARFLILSVHNGIDRSIWYGWHHSGWGTLYDKARRRLLEPGIAYGQVYRWLHQAVVGPCHAENGVYRCPIQPAATQGQTEASLSVWSTRGESGITVPPGFTRYRRLDGTVEAIRPGATVTVGAKPILFER